MNKNPDRMKPDRKVNLPLSILMWLIVAVFAMPFYILIVYAVKPREATMLKNPLSLPTSLCWENFTEAIEKSKFTLAFCNSLIATICGTLLLVIVCSMAAYVIVRRERSRFYNAWQYIFLAAVMLPFQTVMFPLYKNLVNLHMLNTLWGYVLVSVGFQLGFNIFLYCGFIKTVPLELEEAAQIDGCNAYGTYFKIVFPLLKPITMTVVVLAALGIWNDYQIALVVIMKDNVRTLPVAQQAFIGQQISYHNLAAAACLLSIIPMFLLFLFLQKFIVKGIAAGAVKGYSKFIRDLILKKRHLHGVACRCRFFRLWL